MLYPDNFLYFILLFFVSVNLGTYLLFSYKRNLLIILNAVACYLTAIRACTEFYLPQIALLSDANNMAIFHSCIASTISVLFYYIIWFYIRPFRNWKREKIINKFYLYTFLILPSLIKLWTHFYRKIYYFHHEKIADYWQFKVHYDYFLTGPVFLYDQLMGYLMIAVFIISIVREKQHRLQKTFLALSFVIFPYIFFNFFILKGEWVIPNVAILFLIHAIIITWFVSDYRLFEDNFTGALKDILNSISDLAIFTDLKMGVLHSNLLAQQQFSNNFLTKKNIIEVIASFSNQTYSEIQLFFQHLMNKQVKQKELTLVFNQKVKKYNLQVADFYQGKEHQGYTFLFTDLTEIREKEQQLQEANATKDRLFAIIGHDLRKPSLAFRNIGKKINYLLKAKDFNRLNKLGGTIEKNALAMNKLTDNLLNWALVKKNTLAYQPELVNLESVTNEELTFFESIIEDKQLELTLDFAKGKLVQADLNAMRTIIRNLLDNAIKYTPSCGEIYIYTETHKKELILLVKDTGIGIPKEKLTTIFQLQNNKSEEGTEGEKGTGIGLHIVQELIKINKGTIKATSMLNKGTIIEVFFPQQ